MRYFADVKTVYAVVVSILVIIIVGASIVFTVILSHFKKIAKSSKLCAIRQNRTVTEGNESSGYNIINYNEMAGNSVLEMKKNSHENNTTPRPSQDTQISIQRYPLQ